MKKGIKIAIIVAASTIVVGAALFNGIYFGVVMRDRPFSITITDIDPQDMGPKEWEEDFLALYDMVKDNYPFLAVKERTHGYDWLDLKDHFLDRISEVSSNQEFLAVIYDAIQALQNHHTHIVHPGEASFWGSFFEGYSPYQDVFTYDVTTANAYWSPYYNMFLDDNIRIVYEALPLYDHGQYVIHDGVGEWVEEYGNRSVILAVNDVPIDEAVLNCYEKGYLEYDFIREKLYLPAITTYHFGEDAIFTIQNTTGHVVNRTISSTFGGYLNPWNYPVDTLQTQILENDTTAYIHIQSFWGSNIPYDYAELAPFYTQINDFDHLIIDIRGNGGGSTNYWMDNIVIPLSDESYQVKNYFAFRRGDYVQYFREAAGIEQKLKHKEVAVLPPEARTRKFDLYNASYTFNALDDVYDFEGEIILLVDNYVYSAAENFANFCKETGFATIYGTHTAGDGIGITPMYFVLPNSKLIIRMSCLLGIDGTGQANEEVRTEPDIIYESMIGNWTELIDYTIANLP